MAESIAAIGLVASVIQLADFAARLLKRLDEFKSDRNEVPGSFRAIKTQLECRVLSEDAAQALNALLEACLQDLEYLQHLLVKSSPQPAASTWERRLSALKSLGKDKAIEKRLKQLDGHLQAFIFHEISIFRTLEVKNLLPTSLPVSNIGKELPTEIFHTATALPGPFHTPEVMQLAVWQGRLLSKPSLFHEIARDVTSPEDGDCQIVHSHSRPVANMCRKICTCPQFNTPKLTWSSLRGFELFSRVIHQHRSSCPFFRPDASTWEFGFKGSGISHQLQKVVDVAFTLTFGAGGFSINPSLVLRGFVRKDSPAFQALDNVSWLRKRGDQECPNHETYDSEVNQLLEHLQSLYQSGKASPNEVLENGNTIAMEIYWRKRLHADHQPMGREISLYEGLINFGVHINQVNNTSSTILDSVLKDVVIFYNLEKAPAYRFVDTLMDYGAEMLKLNGGFLTWLLLLWKFDNFMETLERIPDFAEACCCNALSLAILSRSELNVTRSLRRSHEDLNIPNVLGQFPLHLAVKWPWAISMLLEAGAKVGVEDENGWRPLSYACKLGSLESVQMLLDAGSTLSDPDGTYPYFSRTPPLHHASIRGNVVIFKAVLRSLVSRRQDLLRKSLQYLPTKTVLSIVKNLDHVLEGNEVEKLVRELQAHGHLVDIHAYAGDHSNVYYTPNLDAERAELLFSSEFNDIHAYAGDCLTGHHAYDFNDARPELYRSGFIHSHILMDRGEGGSPLAATAYRGYYQPTFITWLVARGANLQHLLSYKLYGRSEIIGISTVHYVAFTIGNQLGVSWKDGLLCRGRLLEKPQISTLGIITSALLSCTDECICLCSKQGCTPALTFLKLYLCGRAHFPDWIEVCSSMVQHVINGVKHDDEDMRRLGGEALRLIIFQRLELMHTCCQTEEGWLRKPINSTDAEEIRVEEREIICEFEVLVKSAEEEWGSTTESFYMFAKRFLTAKFEVSAQMQVVDEDYPGRVKAVGVRIWEQSSCDGANC